MKNIIKIFRIKYSFNIWLDDFSLVKKSVFINECINRFNFFCVNERNFNLDYILFFLESDNDKFIFFIIYQEIYGVVFYMKVSKVLRSDGFGSIFFYNYWYLVGLLVV